MNGTCPFGQVPFSLCSDFDTKYMMLKQNFSWEMFCDSIYNLYLYTE